MSVSRPEARPAPGDLLLRLGREIELAVDGKPVGLSPAQRAYLVLLVHGREEGVRRDEVIRLMWGGAEDRPARHRVRQLTYTVNRKSGAEVIRADGPWLRLDSTLAIDWDGSPFWEFMNPPTVAYRDHLSEVGERLEKSEELDSLRRLDAARRADAPAEVLRALEEGPRPPDAWRDLLWALLRTGRIREAEFELKRILGDELPAEGPTVARRLATVAEELLDIAAAGTEGDLPLLGRAEDTNRLQELVVSGAPCIVITGVHGVGRSRMLGQVVAGILSSREDAVVLSATGSPAERNIPFGGLGQLLDEEILVQAFHELGQPETEVIRRALPVQFQTEESHLLAPLGGPGSYLRIARALEKLFRKAFGAADVLLVIDDLDHLDRSSVEVVTRLALLESARILCTWCIQDETSHAEFLFRMQGLSPQVVPLADLTFDDAQDLAESVDPELGRREAEDVARLSGGRPGRIVELVRALRGSPLLASPLGTRLDDLLRRRIRELDPDAQEVLVLVAISGGRMAIHLLAKVLDCGVLKASGFVRELEESGLVRVDGRRVAIAPGLLRDFICRELPDGIKRTTHQRVADQLRAQPKATDPGLIAHHLDEAGQPREAAGWYLKAGTNAQERTALAEAVTFLERHIATADGAAPNVLKGLGELHAGKGQFQQSVHWFSQAQAGYLDRGDLFGDVQSVLAEVKARMDAGEAPGRLFQLLSEQLHRADKAGHDDLVANALDLWFWLADHFFAREEVFAARIDLLRRIEEGPSDGICWVGGRLAYLGDPAQGYRLARRAYLRGRENIARDPRSLHRLLLCCLVQGRFSNPSTTALTRFADRIAERVGNLPQRCAIWLGIALGHMGEDENERATELLQRAEESLIIPSDQVRVALVVNQGIVAIRTGRIQEADSHIRRLDEIPTSHSVSVQATSNAIRMIVALETGRMAEASDLDEQLAALDLSYPVASDLSIVAEARAELMRRRGERRDAVPYLRRTARVMGEANIPCARRLNGKADLYAVHA